MKLFRTNSNEVLVCGNFTTKKALCECANLAGVNLRGVNLAGVNLRGLKIKNGDFRDSNFRDSDLTGSYLTGINFTGSYLTGINFIGSYLTGINFTGANIDFISLPLSCTTLNVKWDEKHIIQFLFHAAKPCQHHPKIVRDEDLKNLLTSNIFKKVINKFHRIKESEKFDF